MHRFIFICGLHRSGTTLLFRILRDHEKISGFSDTGVSADEGQLLQTVFPPASHFGGPGKFGFDRRSHLNENSPLAIPASRDKLMKEWGRHWDLESPFLLEKSPPTLVRTRFFQALFDRSCFITITRHPLAVALATRKWSDSRLGVLLKHWLVCHDRFAADQRYLRRCLVIKYEDLVISPQATSEKVFDFLGLENRPVGEEVHDANQSYREQWAERKQHPLLRAYDRYLVLRYEKSFLRHGYSLRDFQETPGSNEKK